MEGPEQGNEVTLDFTQDWEWRPPKPRVISTGTG